MGFYGNVANSNKTAFSFDKTYATRTAMDASAQTDGVFLGRYVLVEYDEPMIEGYAKTDGGLVVSFHTNVSRSAASKITPKIGRVYHDLTLSGAYNAFYEWVEAENGYYRPVTANTGYAASFAIDVLAYGRGYDSTAWQKTWNEESKAYKYVMVAELNTIVPNFHLIVDAPSNIMAAPYFDADATTNIDYFLHLQASFGQSVRSAGKSSKNYEINDGRTDNTVHDALGLEYSDEIIQKKVQRWNADTYGNLYATIIDTSISAQQTLGDIYYNKAGFDRAIRTLSPRDENDATKSAIANTINYDYDRSGRLYYDRSSLKSSGSWWTNGLWADDMMEWYIHLPALGDAICEMWDRLYGYSKTDAHRYLNIANSRGEDSPLITYDPTVSIGLINTTRDILGYVLVDLAKLDPSIANILTNNIYSAADRKNAINNLLLNEAYVSYSNSVTLYLYYTKLPGTVEDQDVKEYYYAYTYLPLYEPVHKENGVWKYNTSDYGERTFTDHELFYKNSNNEFKLVNKANEQFLLSDGSYVEPYLTLYGELPRWRLTMLATPKEDSIYGLILHLHELIGEENDLRTYKTLNGSLNILKDVVDNIDSLMKPFTLVTTNIDGHVINALEYSKNTSTNKWEETDKVVEFPYFNSVDSQEILDCSGHWRLPVNFKLETFTLKDNEDKYFNKYWGNSTYHELEGGLVYNGNYDTIGDAFFKISEDLSDLLNRTANRIIDFTTDKLEAITGETVVLRYTINGKAPWKSIYYTVNSSNNLNVVTRSNNQEYLTGTLMPLTAALTMGAIDLVITLHIIDEREVETTETITVKHCNKFGYVVTNETPTINNYAVINKKVEYSVNVEPNNYLYVQVPTAQCRIYIDGELGGFDLYDDTNHIYKSTNHSLGYIDVTIRE